MNIIRTFTTEDLGKTRPANLAHSITAAKHFAAFYALDTCDVWTEDGYLVTAVQNDGVTHHLRKGTQVVVAELPADQVFMFNATPKAAHYLGLAAAEAEQQANRRAFMGSLSRNARRAQYGDY